MQTAYIHLIKYAINQGCTLSVWDGEEWQVKRSTSLKDIREAVKSVDEAKLRIRDQDGNIVASALVSAYGLEPDETIMDSSTGDWMDAHDQAYNATMA